MESTWRPNWAGVALGLVIAAVAGSVSLGSFEAASRGGGSYVVLWGAVFVGAAMAIRSLTRTSATVEAESRRRIGEARAQTLQAAMGASAWQEAKRRQMAAAGTLLSDAEVANREVSDSRTREEERAARWRTNAAELYAPIVEELKGSMTATQWAAKRDDATYSMKASREQARRYWLDNSAGLPPALRSLPRALDPSLDREAEDWQVAMYIRPMKLDGEGRPITQSS